jgi:RAP1 GTPase activating protein 1
MSVDVSNTDFRIEKTNSAAKITGVHESLLQECEKDIIWYRDNFFGKSKYYWMLG